MPWIPASFSANEVILALCLWHGFYQRRAPHLYPLLSTPLLASCFVNIDMFSFLSLVLFQPHALVPSLSRTILLQGREGRVSMHAGVGPSATSNGPPCCLLSQNVPFILWGPGLELFLAYFSLCHLTPFGGRLLFQVVWEGCWRVGGRRMGTSLKRGWGTWQLLFTQVHIYLSCNTLWIFPVLIYTRNFLEACARERGKRRTQKVAVKHSLECLWGHWLPQA